MDFSLLVGNEIRHIYTYIANDHKYFFDGNPYEWYLNLVVAGARENGFPGSYISMLETIDSDRDKNSERREKCESLIKNSASSNFNI